MLKALGIILLVIAFVAWLVLHRRGLRVAAAEWSTRTPMSDAQFLSLCDVPKDSLHAQAALAARRAIASLATVPADTIRPEDSFADDLQKLPYWDSLDWLGFIFEVEKQSDYRILVANEVVEEEMRAAGGYRKLKVSQLVRAVAASVRPRDEVPERQT
jgi:hypothetical protein